MARTPIAVCVLGLGIGAGCDGLCDGPGCESSFPAARLSVVRGALAERATDVWDEADGRYDGALDEGSSWIAAALPGRVLLGQPEATGGLAARVVSMPVRDGVGPVRVEAEWIGAGTEFGSAIAAVPAVDGSDAFDLWVGAPAYAYGKGAVHLFRGAQADARREAAQADLTIVSATPNDRFGARVLGCPDLTGDRLPDLLVSAPWFATPADWPIDAGDGIPALAGAVFLLRSELLGAGEALPWEVGTTWWGLEAGEGAGHALACDRDVDGDGLVDVVIGAPWAGGTRGRVYLLASPLPASGRLDEVATITLDGIDEEGWFGTAIAPLTVDGAPALAVGAAGWGGGAGRVHLYDGPSLRQLPTRLATFEAPPERAQPDHLGRWLYRGDFDGDLRDDLVVGAPDYRGDGPNAFDTGRMWVWLGAGSDLWEIGTATTDADHALVGAAPFQRIGRAAAVADVDRDGLDDLLVPTRASDPEDEE